MIASFESKLSIFKLKQQPTFELNYPAIEQNSQAFSKVYKKNMIKAALCFRANEMWLHKTTEWSVPNLHWQSLKCI